MGATFFKRKATIKEAPKSLAIQRKNDKNVCIMFKIFFIG